MIIKKLIIKNFKKFRYKVFEFNDDINILVGDNSTGKSSILEAIELGTNCSFRGKPLSLETALELMNFTASTAYLTGDLTHPTLPEIVIEIYLDGVPEYRGTNNSLTEDAQGVVLNVTFDLDLLTKFDELIKDPANVRTVPIELFKIEWHDFAGKSIKQLNRKAKSLLIDPSRLHPTYGKNQYITALLAAALSKEELAHLNLDYRQLKNVFDGQQHVMQVNKSLDADKVITNGTLKIIADIAANRSVETSLQLAVDDVAFPLIGKGEQSQIQIKLAIQNKAKAVNFLLLEEPENHVSHMNLTRLINYIETNRNGLQVFISTHSSYVLNKLSIAKLCFVASDFIRLKDIDPKIAAKIKRLPGYDTLRAVLANKVILVEGPSDELLLKKLYLDKHGKLPEDDGIEIIVVRGLGFDTYLEITKRIGVETLALKDNDGDYKANIETYREKYKAFPSIKVLSPTDNGLNSLEPALIAEHCKTAADLDTFARVILSTETYNKYLKEPDLAAKTTYLREWFGGPTGSGKKKVDAAMRIFESDEAITYPAYLAGAFNFA